MENQQLKSTNISSDSGPPKIKKKKCPEHLWQVFQDQDNEICISCKVGRKKIWVLDDVYKAEYDND